MKKYLFIILCYIITSGAFSQNLEFCSFPIPKETNQVIVVTSKDWDTPTGDLQCYQRYNDTWAVVGEKIPVALGKHGLAWGRGLHKNTSSAEKREGDGKAPAGVFALGTLFGYADKSPNTKDYPYKQSTSRDYWVDDPDHADYNHWETISINKENNPRAYWASFERMKRSDHLYEYGIVVRHNMQPIIQGKGSAIFMHVWRSPGSPTLGCTAMDKEDLLAILKWLDPKDKPILIQLPESEMQQVQ